MTAMSINRPEAYRSVEEIDLMAELIPMANLKVLELGCGAAWTTRLLVERLGAAAVTATEVDRIQHAKNLARSDLPGVTFRYGGAERIEDPDESYDLAVMLKSLHHVPVPLMGQALREIHRVLKPGGRLYCCEPVYWGEFNEIMRLIEDERAVREAAFAALQDAMRHGLFALEREVFFVSEGVYADWPSFAARFLDVTHSERQIDSAQRARIRAAFEAHLTPAGARFRKPHRVDLLRRLPVARAL